MKKIDILFLNRRDVEEINLSNGEVIQAVENSVRAQGNGQVVLDPRQHLIPDPSFEGHFNILRAYIKPLDVAGVKVVGDYVRNYQIGLPSELALLTLYDPKTGIPRAIIDATEITSMRTGALTALGAKYLARKDSKILGHVGSRGTAWYNVVMLDSIFNFNEIRVTSKRTESREKFAARLSEHLKKPVKCVGTSEECLVGADIMVEAARLSEPQVLLKTDWVRPGNFVMPYGTVSAVEISLTDVMDKVVVDHWAQCTVGPLGSLRKHVDTGKLNLKTLHAELGEIVAGKKAGRESEKEKILFWHRGLATNDIAVGQLMLERAESLGIGTRINFR